MSLATQLADLISEYLGPAYPRPSSQTSSCVVPGKKNIPSLVVLRNRIVVSRNTQQFARDALIWQLREAIRTEFFQIQYPVPPSKSLLSLVTRSELMVTDYKGSQRPIYFPGARVAVPTEVGTHRAATTLQLRFKSLNSKTVTEVLLHLDGPGGGSFQWVPSTILMLLSSCVPIPNPDSRGQAARNLPNRPTNTNPGTRSRRPVPSSTLTNSTLNANVRSNRGSRSRKTENRGSTPRSQITMLPASFIPYALRSTSPPPRKRLRPDSNYPLSLSTGSLREALKLNNLDSIVAGPVSDCEIQSSILNNTLGIERLVGRRKNLSLGNQIQYCVKWCGSPLIAASWELRETLMRDVPGLVVAFDIAHPGEPPSCRAIADNSATEDDSFDIASKEGMDCVSSIFPIVCIRFAGMQLHIEDGCKYRLYTSEDEFKLERKKRIVLLKGNNREAFDKIFSSNSSEFQVEPTMKLQPDTSIMSVPTLNGNLLSVLQKSVDSHHMHNRTLIPFPRGLGRALSCSSPSVIPNSDIQIAPASWENYFLTMGLSCHNWKRELLPDMPTASEGIVRFVERKSEELTAKAVHISKERNKMCLRKTRMYAGRSPSLSKKTSTVETVSEPSSSVDDSSIVRAALELAESVPGKSVSTIWAEYTSN